MPRRVLDHLTAPAASPADADAGAAANVLAPIIVGYPLYPVGGDSGKGFIIHEYDGVLVSGEHLLLDVPAACKLASNSVRNDQRYLSGREHWLRCWFAC